MLTEALVRLSINQGLAKPRHLAELIREIDLEDGTQDGQLKNASSVPDWCPEREAKVPPGKAYCVFCGEHFEDDADRILELIDRELHDESRVVS